MRIGPVNVPDPQALLGLPSALAKTVDALGELTDVLRNDVDSAVTRGDEIRELRGVAEQLHADLNEVRAELGWVRANLESIQDRVPGLSPPGG